jgi:hypothetical protein
LIRPIFLNANFGGKATRTLVHQRTPQNLGDAVGRRRPSPKAEGGGVFHGGKAIVEALDRALAANKLINHFRPPGEGREAVDNHVDAEVEVRIVSVRNRAPWPEVDVEAVHLEIAALRAHNLVSQLAGGELDKVLLWEVGAHHQLGRTQAELATEDVVDIGAVRSRRRGDDPRHDGGALPVQALAVEVVRGCDEAGAFLLTHGRVAEEGHGRRRWAWIALLPQFARRRRMLPGAVAARAGAGGDQVAGGTAAEASFGSSICRRRR